jgi:capsular polysaccharide transport system permease protein
MQAPLAPRHRGEHALPPGGPVPFQRLRVLFAMVVRETGTKFGRSYGGYLWAIAEPLGGVVMLTLVFSLALRNPPLGDNFALFYATGVIPFMLFNNVSHSVAAAVATNRGLLRYPVVTPLDTVFSKFILDFLTMFMVAVLLYSGVILVYGLEVTFDPGPAALAFVLAGLLGLGLGTMNCVLFGFFPTWRNVWNVLTRPLFLMSGMFYTFQSLPTAAQDVLWWNPLIHVVGLMRAGFYGSYEAAYASPLYVLGIAGSLFVVGAYLLRRHASVLIEG